MEQLIEDWPFLPKPQCPRSFLQRLFRIRNHEDAVIAINNLFASHRGLAELRPQEIAEVLDEFRVSAQRLRSDFREMTSALLVFVIENGNEADLDTDLRKVSSLFPLDRADFASALSGARKEVYGRAIDRFIEDGRLSKQEKLELEALRLRLGLSEGDGKSVYAERAQRRIARFVQFITEDQRISPVEDRRLSDMAQSLGVTLQLDKSSDHVFQRYRTLWAIEHGELPVISAPIPLRRGEVCHFFSECSWHEYRVTSTTVVYGGFRSSTKIIKGLYAVGGAREYRPVHQESLVPVDSGSFYVTSDRVVFVGSVGSKKGISIPLSGIADVSIFSDGLMLRRNSGKNPFIKFDADVDICSMILAQLLGQ